AFLGHRVLSELSPCGDSGKHHAEASNDLLSFWRGKEFHPFPRFFLMFTADPDRVCQTIKHCLAPGRTNRQKREADIELAVFLRPMNIPRAKESQCAFLACKECVCSRLSCVLRRNNEALFQLPIGNPLDCLGELWVIVVELFGPRSVVELEPVRYR